ncbi:hypothetical protein HMPREF1565_1985 [Providencia alcalifaciens RIMD 1656011]|uniref:Uncharacterized protein n=1 Tax=Providencia alcalifaciens 205/92 TaxID=1256988 RepID=A0AAV3M6C0_9GAMM|nr:hypothetical protein HMPREF1565_1985 [Providencia alcalifaciens RIMD 1656011]EUD11024.1 hypothetical protein HMPREF1563_2758 [Providencia alcalifaciens 205/92]
MRYFSGILRQSYWLINDNMMKSMDLLSVRNKCILKASY